MEKTITAVCEKCGRESPGCVCDSATPRPVIDGPVSLALSELAHLPDLPGVCPVCGAGKQWYTCFKRGTGDRSSWWSCQLGGTYHYALWRLRAIPAVSREIGLERAVVERVWPQMDSEIRGIRLDERRALEHKKRG